MSTHRSIPINECHDPLVEIPRSAFAFTTPHAYVALGAPYGSTSPWMLRNRVLAALMTAQAELSRCKPGWRLKLFDAYPDHYAQEDIPELRAFHQNRCLLNEVMSSADFARHGNEWWHFSLGDQMWAWLRQKSVATYRAVTC